MTYLYDMYINITLATLHIHFGRTGILVKELLKNSKKIYLIESGIIPIRFLIRIMYWWHILHVKKSDMLYKVYSAHKISQFQGDWVKLLEAEKIFLQDQPF